MHTHTSKHNQPPLLQSLQAELAAAQLEKQTLLHQALATSESSGLQGARSDAVTKAGTAPPSSHLSLPPKVPVISSHAASTSSKQPPLRSLSWGSSKAVTKQHHGLPQRQGSLNAVPDALMDTPQNHQPFQQSVIQQWLAHEQVPSSCVSDSVDNEAVRQEVLREVLQAVVVNSAIACKVDLNSLTVKVTIDKYRFACMRLITLL